LPIMTAVESAIKTTLHRMHKPRVSVGIVEAHVYRAGRQQQGVGGTW
jgi:hypothetical protein